MIKDKVNKFLNEEIRPMTTSSNGHFHFYTIDQNGNGATDFNQQKHTDNHNHKIIAYKLQPGGENQHVHKLIIKMTAMGASNEYISKLGV